MNDPAIPILLVDDDKEDYLITKDLFSQFSQNNFHLSWCQDYPSAIEEIRSGKYQAYLVDFQLNGKDGIMLIEEARRQNVQEPLILLTGMHDRSIDLKAMQAGASDYLVKSDLTPALLERSLRYALVRNRAEEQREKLFLERSARLEAELQEQYYRTIAEAIPQIVWTATSKGKIDFYNQRWFDFTGLTKTEIITDEMLQNIVHPDDYDRYLKLWQTSLKTGTNFSADFRFKSKKNHEYRWFLGRAVPVQNDKGRIIKWFGTHTDIDEQKKAHQALELAEERKNEFIGIASHELKTPLTTIKAFTQLLQKYSQNKGDQTIITYLGKIDNHVDKLTNLIADLLDINKIESGKIKFKHQKFDLNELIHEVANDLTHTTTTHEIITKDLAKTLIFGDRERIGQVIANLLFNAIKYSPNAKTVEIRSYLKGKNVVIEVQDYGIGIPKDKISNIFERFYRINEPDRKDYPGMGLGLYISAEIVQRHKGEISVKSQVGQGTTFYVALPLT